VHGSARDSTTAPPLMTTHCAMSGRPDDQEPEGDDREPRNAGGEAVRFEEQRAHHAAALAGGTIVTRPFSILTGDSALIRALILPSRSTARPKVQA